MLQKWHKRLLVVSLFLLISVPAVTWRGFIQIPRCTDPYVPWAILLYEGQALRACRTGSEINVGNISAGRLAIRVSWDGQDPYGTGDCPETPEDCFIDDSVELGELLRAKIKTHSSVQVWAWGPDSNLLVDFADLPLAPQ
jgi:hypothetical protein